MNTERHRLLTELFLQASELDAAERKSQVAAANLSQARANARSAQIQLDYTVIRAPVSGVVASVSTQVGETVAASFASPTFVTIIDLVMAGYGTVIGSHWPPVTPYYKDMTARFPYDPQKAKALLTEAGYPDGFAATIKLPAIYPYSQRAGEVIADMLGRKIEMDDPDMGAWDYGYDPAGNLAVQDDAEHQRTCFYYDELNRLTGKYYTDDGTLCPSSPTHDVSYTYDDGTYGEGRRTGMTDASGSTSCSTTTRGTMPRQRVPA